MTKRRKPDSRIDEEMLREEMLREEEIRLKVESILDEEDEDVFEEMILGLDEEELDALDEAMGEMEEYEDEDFDEENLNESYEDSGKARLYEMAQPRHRKVTLNIPIRNNPYDNPVTITFMAKNPTSKGDFYRYIDMGDDAPDAVDRIVTQIYLVDNEGTGVSGRKNSKENTDIRRFAKEVADKYGKGSSLDKKDIIDAIVSCYNNIVVDHNAKASGRLPSDYYYVEWDSVNRCIVPR